MAVGALFQCGVALISLIPIVILIFSIIFVADIDTYERGGISHKCEIINPKVSGAVIHAKSFVLPKSQNRTVILEEHCKDNFAANSIVAEKYIQDSIINCKYRQVDTLISWNPEWTRDPLPRSPTNTAVYIISWIFIGFEILTWCCACTVICCGLCGTTTTYSRSFAV